MKEPQVSNITRPGDNHTGIALHPDLVAEMIEGTTEFGPTSGGDAELIAQNRIRVARISEPAATMPPSPRIAVELLPLIDKLGARLAFERAGTRLYQALISKLDAYGSFSGGPTRQDLEQIRDQEHCHMLLAQQLIENIGGDPTVVTPCANLQSFATRGICDVLVDPRTNLIECLGVIVVAELTDHESWDQLAQAASLAGQRELEPMIRQAEQTEAEHLTKVRSWLAGSARLAAKPGD